MKLTESERDLMTLLAKGATRNYAAFMLSTSPSGVARILSGLYASTGAATTSELLSFLLVTGSLTLTPDDFPDCTDPGAQSELDPYAGLATTEDTRR